MTLKDFTNSQQQDSVFISTVRAANILQVSFVAQSGFEIHFSPLTNLSCMVARQYYNYAYSKNNSV